MLEPSKLSTAVLWSKWEDFCKPQGNELKARYDHLKSFSQAGLYDDERYNTVLKHLATYSYPQVTTSILYKNIFLFGLPDQDFLAKWLSQTSKDWNADKIKHRAKSWKVVSQPPNIWEVYLQANHKHISINWGIRELTLTNTKRREKRGNLHTWHVNPMLLQFRNSDAKCYQKPKFLLKPYKFMPITAPSQ